MPTDRGVTPLQLISAAELGAMLGVSAATVRKYDREEAIPRPALVEGEPHWSRPEIRRWINQGLPPRATWEAEPSATCLPQLKKADQD